MEKKLYRSTTDSMLTGVCGGIGEYLQIDSTIVRIFAVILALHGMGVLLYIAMAIIVPIKPQ